MDKYLLSECGQKLYPLGDSHPKARFGYMRNTEHSDPNIMAINSHKYSCPRKGEWYLSGAAVQAFRAPNDLSYAYWIAKIVRVKKITVHRILEPLDN